MNNDLTTGSIFKKLIAFAIPFFLTYFLEALYGGVDILVTGRFCHTEALAAVNVGTQVIQIITSFIIGISVGSTVKIGNAFGAKDNSEISKSLYNTILISIFLSIVLTITFSYFSKDISIAMQTPYSAIEECSTYIFICAIGIPFIILFNQCAGIVRAFGDSMSPLIASIVSCVINIFGDIIFAMNGMGVFGIALSTTLAQVFSSIVILIIMLKKDMGFTLIKNDFKYNLKNIKEILFIGIPIASQDTLVNLSFLILTAIVNSRGIYAASGAGIVERILTFMFIIPYSFLASISAFVAQNEGAKKHNRSLVAVKYSVKIVFAFSIIMVLIAFLIPDLMIGCFTNDLLVIEQGRGYLQSYVFDVVTVSYIFPINGYLSGTNRSIIAFLHSIITTFILRLPLALLLSKMYPDSLFPMGIAAPIATIVSIIIVSIYFIVKKEYIFRVKINEL